MDVLRARTRGSLSRLVASSSGNHGQGVAYAGRLLNIPVTIFLPERANPIKAAMIEALGADIRSAGSDSYSAKIVAREYAEKEGCHFVDDGDSVDLSEGAGTVGFEIAQRLENIDAVFIPVGDAALINGSSCALKASQPNVKIIGVQAERAKALAESRRTGKIVEIMPDTIADGLATRAPAQLALAGMMAFVNEFALVQEAELLSAIHTLAVAGHILAEPSGAASFAAAWKLRESWKRKRIVLIITGSNASSEVLASAFQAPPLWNVPGAHGAGSRKVA